MSKRSRRLGNKVQQSQDLLERSASKITLLAALLVVMTVIVYLPAMCGGFIWDDDDYVQNNQVLRSADGLHRIWFQIGATSQYYPMVYTTYWLEYQFWKLNPTGYHVVNILLHTIGAVLLWRVLTLLRIPGAWLHGLQSGKMYYPACSILARHCCISATHWRQETARATIAPEGSMRHRWCCLCVPY
jgi:hypothetical protein